MSGIEDISDDNNENIDEREEEVNLSDKYQPVGGETLESEPTVSNSETEADSERPTGITKQLDDKVEDKVDTENYNKDSEVGDKAENALKVIAMCKWVYMISDSLYLQV